MYQCNFFKVLLQLSSKKPENIFKVLMNLFSQFFLKIFFNIFIKFCKSYPKILEFPQHFLNFFPNFSIKVLEYFTENYLYTHKNMLETDYFLCEKKYKISLKFPYNFLKISHTFPKFSPKLV